MVATVTGIAPFVSMLRHAIHRGERRFRFVVLQGASYQDEFAYREEPEAASARHPGLLAYISTVSRPGEERNRGWAGATGRVNLRASGHDRGYGPASHTARLSRQGREVLEGIARPLRVGLAVSLSGPLAPMGIGAHRGLALWAEAARPGNRRVELVVRDDRGDRVLVRRQVEELLVRERVDLLAGPYSSGLTRAAAPLAETHGVVLWNHGGAADDIHRRGYRMVVGIPTPASRYMLPALRWATGGPVVILHRAASGFSAAVARGAEVEAARQGRAVRLEPYPTTREGLENFLGGVRAERPGLLVAAGRLADDVAIARALRRRRIVVPTALVAAGVRAFGEALGAAADGFVGPSQWEPTAPLAPDLGPTPHAFARRFRTRFGVMPDYPAAQAYAAGLIMGRCIEVAGGLDRERLRAAAASLEVTTLFGPFRIDSGTGMQVGHEMLLVDWVRGRRRMIELPPSK